MDLFQTNNTFWDVLESDFCAIPKYIKNILTFCNFGNVLSLQKFENDDIIKIEQIAKNQFKNWLDEHEITTNLIDFFGPIYYSKPDQFTFTCGDIKMIQQISECVRSTVQKKGYGYLKGEISPSPQNVERNESNGEEELQEQLFNGILNLLQPYGECVTSLFKKDMVIVGNQNGVINGRVRCIICDTESETGKKSKKRRQELYSQYWNGHKWLLSNFAYHHLQKIHPIEKDTNQGPKDKVVCVAEDTMQTRQIGDDFENSSSETNSIDNGM
ncbi:uncharacterized protein LOC116337085 [Contarinia nasturtii]|uniref:uncharacterized protein LOC116337085 n=1 Tax=Contarinia nasturtii TaxID=265458 RepID=UPI0012D41637|nr:uncharacterized protein LOC116337085 [Contarinia nasturtii]